MQDKKVAQFIRDTEEKEGEIVFMVFCGKNPADTDFLIQAVPGNNRFSCTWQAANNDITRRAIIELRNIADGLEVALNNSKNNYQTQYKEDYDD
jgi:hypothetical protein